MAKHEIKICPKCNKPFECKVGSPELCQCSRIQLNHDERDYIQKLYEDCLCISCLHDLKAHYHYNVFKEKLKKISSLFS
ncbi:MULTISPECIES: cysteine-rich CWC family protein [Apibacter]|uniref:cysteine-rich CWC family protein n=1 Tax=Apibacter TaxID=1778601 RepID=UPI000FE3C744